MLLLSLYLLKLLVLLNLRLRGTCCDCWRWERYCGKEAVWSFLSRTGRIEERGHVDCLVAALEPRKDVGMLSRGTGEAANIRIEAGAGCSTGTDVLKSSMGSLRASSTFRCVQLRNHLTRDTQCTDSHIVSHSF
ncbi:hypothetical protein MLD38_037400 [Melastoma candidum]|uniref:Uncharacterized protein n=1 Tax=Melastoma candidum TaxID=119954 RepID=A0ACB9LMM1_9MYRT|nr:hypothetical protein MLD38_037400 [Melastoma candidum]